MALVAFWSPKGGSGTSVVAAATAVVLGARGGARVVDLVGDQPAVLGLGHDPDPGLADWIALGADAPPGGPDALTVEVTDGVALLPTGGARAARRLGERVTATAGAALAAALRGAPVVQVVDAGDAAEGARRAVAEVADATVAVIRPCYLALRRAIGSPLLSRSAGVVLVDEPGRSLGVREVGDVLGRPVLATVPVRPAIARAVDAGVLPRRLPAELGRAAGTVLAAVGVRRGSRGQAA
jgi:hypothetical protein